VFHSHTVDDEGTLAEIRRLHETARYLADPHSAIGIAAGRAHMPGHGIPMVAMGTAHPAKFPEAVEAAIARAPALHVRATGLFDRDERIDHLPADADAVKRYVRQFAGVA
jgi:threonine synthase